MHTRLVSSYRMTWSCQGNGQWSVFIINSCFVFVRSLIIEMLRLSQSNTNVILSSFLISMGSFELLSWHEPFNQVLLSLDHPYADLDSYEPFRSGVVFELIPKNIQSPDDWSIFRRILLHPDSYVFLPRTSVKFHVLRRVATFPRFVILTLPSDSYSNKSL